MSKLVGQSSRTISGVSTVTLDIEDFQEGSGFIVVKENGIIQIKVYKLEEKEEASVLSGMAKSIVSIVKPLSKSVNENRAPDVTEMANIFSQFTNLFKAENMEKLTKEMGFDEFTITPEPEKKPQLQKIFLTDPDSDDLKTLKLQGYKIILRSVLDYGGEDYDSYLDYFKNNEFSTVYHPANKDSFEKVKKERDEKILQTLDIID